MATPQLPVTVARLSTSVTIRLIPMDMLSAAALANPASLLQSIQGTHIGAVESFAETNNRPAAIRFEMNSDAPGVVQEETPNQVEARTITLERVVLYASDVLDIFSIQNGDVVYQNTAFALIKTEVAPLAANVPTRITIYQGCWFTSNPKLYAVKSDLKIIQSVNITYAERTVVSV